MLTKLRLRNWQNHQEIEVPLSTLTVFCGPNGAGKSAIIRALKWICLGEWDGEAGTFITWGEKEAVGTLEVDGHIICRGRTGKSNLYLMDDQEYPSPGGVPEPISKLLNLSPHSFQNQEDPSFWVSLSGPKATEALNELFNLTQIDDALANVAGQVRKVTQEVSFHQEYLTQGKERLVELEWVAGCDEELLGLEYEREVILELDAKIDSLKVKAEQVQEATGLLESFQNLLTEAETALTYGEQVLERQQMIDRLQVQLSTQRVLDNMRVHLKTDEARLEEWMEGKCPLCGREGGE